MSDKQQRNHLERCWNIRFTWQEWPAMINIRTRKTRAKMSRILKDFFISSPDDFERFLTDDTYSLYDSITPRIKPEVRRLFGDLSAICKECLRDSDSDRLKAVMEEQLELMSKAAILMVYGVDD